MGRKICDSSSGVENNKLKFFETKLNGAYIIKLEKLEDERGFFARSWDKQIFENKGLDGNLLQSNISFNKKKGTIRGMHYQVKPYEEAKLVQCTKGKVFEVIIDLRKDSSTYKKWDSVELSQENYNLLYVPKGLALGFQTLQDNTELFYQMYQIYKPEYARGIRYDDPIFNIDWPEKPSIISKRDLSFKPFGKLES